MNADWSFLLSPLVDDEWIVAMIPLNGMITYMVTSFFSAALFQKEWSAFWLYERANGFFAFLRGRVLVYENEVEKSS